MRFAFWRNGGAGTAGVATSAPAAPAYKPRDFGPGFISLERNRVMVTDGALAGQSYSMVTEVENETVRLSMFSGPDKVGHASLCSVKRSCGNSVRPCR